MRTLPRGLPPMAGVATDPSPVAFRGVVRVARRRKLATARTAAKVACAVALAGAGGSMLPLSESADRLEYGEITASPTPDAAPSVGPTVAPVAPRNTVVSRPPAATPRASSSRLAARQPSARPDPTPSAAAAAQRPPMTSGVADRTTAPASCQLPEDMSVWCGAVAVRRLGGTLAFSVFVCPPVEQMSSALHFPTGREADVELRHSSGASLWRWSDGREFARARSERTLDPSRCMVWDTTWSGATRGASVVATVDADEVRGQAWTAAVPD